jgi:hypothetical protein
MMILLRVDNLECPRKKCEKEQKHEREFHLYVRKDTKLPVDQRIEIYCEQCGGRIHDEKVLFSATDL